ncbi:MAG: hypothetical protein IPM51_11880 [Sphingobacteriaceae bacterium]|nr:hypothetical protein [Sphingobacteriaceae bacterium]
MATTSQVKAGLDDIATEIRQIRFEAGRCKITIGNVSAALANLATKYSDVVATIQTFGTTNAFEALSKAELTKLITEYQALKADLDQAVTALSSLTEF